ncbi:MAG: DUF1592 domain-containing protein [Myxococcaceae bacterium]|nr:DUF1592 domain-containing protein [Myxococcaceae bacterium]
MLLLAVAGCEGEIFSVPADHTGPQAATPPPSQPVSPTMPGIPPPTPTQPSTPSNPTNPTQPAVPKQKVYACAASQEALRGTTHRLRRLTQLELSNTLSALLGPTVMADATLQQKLAGLPVDQTVLPGDFNEATPVSLGQVLFDVSKRAVTLAMADATWKTQHLGACAAQATISDTCVASALRSFGAQVWRRDLTDAEVQLLTAQASQAGGGAQGLTFALRRLFQSPALVFHLEVGGTPGTDGRVRLTDFEVASRLSYLAAGVPPDDALMAAARAGQLSTAAQLAPHARRLLATPQGQAKVKDFFRYYTALSLVPDPSPTAAALLGLSSTSGLGVQMRTEAFDFIDAVYRSQGGFAELMGSTAAFPRSSELAKVLETTIAPAGGASASASHPGLMHRPALLMSTGPRTSPIVRGAHLRKLFLCDSFGLPDPALVKARQEQVGDVENMPNRDKVATLTSSTTCNGCHSQVNPVGFAFEGFDQLGARRTVETVPDPAGGAPKTWPIVTKVDNVTLEPGGPGSLADSLALAQAMTESFKGRACFARRAFEYFQLATVDATKDGCALSGAENQAHVGSLEAVVVATLANDDVFYRSAP